MRGAFLAIVNLSETSYDGMCDALINGKAGEVLTDIISEVTNILGGNG
jgi:NAD-dependent SIR2 family protein deacetylase